MKSRITRRHLLAAGVGVGMAGLAGCSEGLKKTPIHRLLIENHTTSEHTVHLLLLDAGDISYWRSIQVPVTDADAEVITGTKLAPGFPRSSGEYTLLARLDDNTHWRSMDYTDRPVSEDTCFEIVVSVEDETTLGFLYSIDEAVCDKKSAPSE